VGRRSKAVWGCTLLRLNVQVEKVKELWFDCGEWAECGLEDDYQATKDKFGGGRQWDYKNLLGAGGEDRTVAWRLEISRVLSLVLTVPG